MARNLVSIFQHEGMVVDFITDLIDREVANTLSPGVLFRGNSITTKAVDVFMKVRAFVCVSVCVCVCVFLLEGREEIWWATP